MKLLIRNLLIITVLMGAQFSPIGSKFPIISCPNAHADEAQEMAERAPKIMQAAYEGDWQKVISMAKRDKNRLKDKDDLGWTVLHQAASKGNDKVVIELLKLGADKNARDNTGRNGDRPYDIGKNNNKLSQKVLNMLK